MRAFEKLELIELKLKKKLFKKTEIELAIQRIDWLNPNFDPFDSSDDNLTVDDLEKVYKYSVNLGFFYNFHFPGIN